MKKLDARGVAHLFIPLVAVVGVGLIGTYLLVASHADATNIVVNGGFNNGSAGWTIMPNTKTNFAVYKTGQGGTNPYEGGAYAATNTAGTNGSIYQDIAQTIKSGQTYCATAQLGTEGAGSGAGATMALWMLGGSGNVNGTAVATNLPGASKWTPEKACVTATGAHTSIRIQFYPKIGAPTLVIDAVSVTNSTATAPAPVAPPKPVNPPAPVTPPATATASCTITNMPATASTMPTGAILNIANTGTVAFAPKVNIAQGYSDGSGHGSGGSVDETFSSVAAGTTESVPLAGILGLKGGSWNGLAAMTIQATSTSPAFTCSATTKKG